MQFSTIMAKLVTFLLVAMGVNPLKWSAHAERFELCPVRYFYSLALSLVLGVIDPISIYVTLNFIFLKTSSFDNVTLLAAVSFAEYFFAYLFLIAMQVTQNWAPRKLVQMCNQCRHLYLAIDPERRRSLGVFVGKRNLLCLIIALVGMSTNVVCLNFLTDERPPLEFFLASIVASCPAFAMTMFLTIYNTTLYVLLENFQQINRRLDGLMNTLKGLVAPDPKLQGGASGGDGRRLQQQQQPKERVGNFRMLRDFCDISDQIDALAIFHKDIFNFLANFNTHYSKAMLVFVVNVFGAVVSQAFFFYVNIAVQIRSNGGIASVTPDLQFTGGIFYALMAATQLLFIIEATSAVIDTARATGVQLHQVISQKFDERLEKSIEMFSIQILNEKQSIDVCGLFNLDYQLIYSMIAAVTTYLIILVQFELMRPVVVEGEEEEVFPQVE